MSHNADKDESGRELALIIVGMHKLADELFVEVDALFENGRSRLVWQPSSYGRASGLAALGHLCHHLDVLRNLSETDGDPQLSSLIARHQLETWATGACLLLGDESDTAAFLGQASRLEDFQLATRQELIGKGVLTQDWPLPKREFKGIEPDEWKYQEVFSRAAALLADANIVTGAEHLYDTIYRPLSNQLGAHPTPYVFDKYITRGALRIQVSRIPDYEGTADIGISQSTLNYVTALLMTINYAMAAAVRLEIDRQPLVQTLGRFDELRALLVTHMTLSPRT